MSSIHGACAHSGEGGAGTWSDGKLTTKVGRNSDPVRRVLQTLHALGAPQVSQPSSVSHCNQAWLLVVTHLTCSLYAVSSIHHDNRNMSSSASPLYFCSFFEFVSTCARRVHSLQLLSWCRFKSCALAVTVFSLTPQLPNLCLCCRIFWWQASHILGQTD